MVDNELNALDLKKFLGVVNFFLSVQTKKRRPRINDEIFIVLKNILFFKRFFFTALYTRFFYYKFYLLLHSHTFNPSYLSLRLGKSYFRVDLNKEHPYYSILTYKYKIRKVFSTGFLLKLYNLLFKHLRRNPASYGIVIFFFKKFFVQTRLKLKSLAVIVGYKYKYNSFIRNLIKLFINKYCTGLFFELQAKMLKFKFRRVKAIKKRIKKRLIRNNKKLLK